MNQELMSINQNELATIEKPQDYSIALAKGEFEVMVDTAHKYPRSIHNFMNAAIALATYSEEIAASCIFSLPRKMKNKKTGKYEEGYIKGKSIRLAEIILSVYKNIKVEVRNGTITSTSATAIATITDLENNTTTSDTGEANIHGTHNDATKLATAAARSIALRNAIFRLIPGAFSEEIYKKAVECAVGNQKTFPEKRKSLFTRMARMGIAQEKIFAYYQLEHIEDFTPELVEEMIGIGTAIKQGDIKIDKAFVREHEPEEANEVLNDMIASKNIDNFAQDKLKVHVSDPQDTETFLKEYDSSDDKNKVAKDTLKDIKEKLNN